MRFGERFKRHRVARGVSNYLIQQKTGYSRSNLSALEHGRIDPSAELIELLASVEELGLTAEELTSWLVREKYSAEVIRLAHELDEEEK